MKTNPMQLLYSGHYGVYIPQMASTELPFTTPLTEEQKADLSSPDNEHYWDTWCNVLEKSLTEPLTGKIYFLHQEDDLWAIQEGYSINEFGDLIDESGDTIEP